MRTWIIRSVSLFVFNIAVLLLIDWLSPAKVGWSVIWAAVVMTVLVLFVKPAADRWLRSAAAKTRNQRTSTGEWIAQLFIVFAVAGTVWLLTLMLSGANRGDSWFWSLVIPPIIIAIGWLIYAKVSARLESHAGAIYDRIEGKKDAPAVAAPSAATKEGAKELADGLTVEQRKMLDEL